MKKEPHRRLSDQPIYKIGQEVTCMIQTRDEATGMGFSNKVIGWISAIKASGTPKKDTYEYGITLDMPGCHHNGRPPFSWILEDDVRLND